MLGVVALESRDTLRLRVHERGVGETLACGTGACAAVAAARIEGWLPAPTRTPLHGLQPTGSARGAPFALEPGVGDDVRVRLPGGELRVTLGDDSMTLRGPAVEAFRGEWAG